MRSSSMASEMESTSASPASFRTAPSSPLASHADARRLSRAQAGDGDDTLIVEHGESNTDNTLIVAHPASSRSAAVFSTLVLL